MLEIDCHKTFSLAMKITSLRVILAIVVERGHGVHLMDIRVTFLNVVLDEDIYRMQPPNFAKKRYEHWVCKLNKTIYMLKLLEDNRIKG